MNHQMMMNYQMRTHHHRKTLIPNQMRTHCQSQMRDHLSWNQMMRTIFLMRTIILMSPMIPMTMMIV